MQVFYFFLLQLLKEDKAIIKEGTKTDPALWLDRIAAIFRYSAIFSFFYAMLSELAFPCFLLILYHIFPYYIYVHYIYLHTVTKYNVKIMFKN